MLPIVNHEHVLVENVSSTVCTKRTTCFRDDRDGPHGHLCGGRLTVLVAAWSEAKGDAMTVLVCECCDARENA